MKKNLLILILSAVIVLSVVLFVLGSVKAENKHFENSEISFDYPGNWNIVNIVKRAEIVYLTDPGTGFNFTVYKYPVPANYNLDTSFESKTIGTTENNNVRLVSKRKLNLNGTGAYETTYNINAGNGALEQENVVFKKNGMLYSLVFTNPTGIINLGGVDKSSDIVIGSLKVKNSNVNNPIPTFAWGEVYIPKLSVNWWIRSDTVNAYDFVYHYPESVFPGENGKSGLLGHRTSYSAPFNKIDQLKAGDQVILTDFTRLKKATYQVVSNNDIRWDYETNPWKFESGEPKLDMITCYPPGYTDAEVATHCKLIYVTPLD